MAFIQDYYCPVCEKKTTHINHKCGICLEKEDRIRIAAWNAQTTEEKLQNLRQRIEELERGPIRY